MKYTCWVDYGCEGWVPNEYDTLKEAIEHNSYGSPKRITKDVIWEPKQICPAGKKGSKNER